MKTKTPKFVQRRLAGLKLVGSSRTSPPFCYLVYEVWYSDGSTKFERGKTLYGAAHQITKKGQAKHLRPDLYPILSAAAQLTSLLEEACADLDGVKL